MNLTQEEFDKTVFEFSKALTPSGTYGTNTPRLVQKHARELAVSWYLDASERQKALQHVLSELGEDAENPTEQSEPKKNHYATAGERTFK